MIVRIKWVETLRTQALWPTANLGMQLSSNQKCFKPFLALSSQRQEVTKTQLKAPEEVKQEIQEATAS